MLYGFTSHSPPTRWIIFVFEGPKMFPELLLVRLKDESCFAHIVSLAAGVNKSDGAGDVIAKPEQTFSNSCPPSTFSLPPTALLPRQPLLGSQFLFFSLTRL